MSDFRNVYEDARRASAYDELGLGGTYRLAFECLPGLFARHCSGLSALDFGCGTGRSTRYLKQLYFDVVGVDVAHDMVRIARERDPYGDYRVIPDGDFGSLDDRQFALILSAFTFDNIPGHRRRVELARGLGSLLSPDGLWVNIVSTPEIYLHEWITFSTRDFPENRAARAGEVVRIVTTDYSDARPVEDVLWPPETYRALYQAAGLEVVETCHPKATGHEGMPWKSETDVAPWAIYLLKRRHDDAEVSDPSG